MNSPAGFQTEETARMRLLLGHICADAALHARFLNTLSLLEHIGSRKIMASRSGHALCADTLKHLAEETRHAFFFKRAAEAVAGRPLAYDAPDMLGGMEAGFYMGRLDAAIAGKSKGTASYLYMSLVIELRAVWFYEIYQSVLQGAGSFLKLTSVLAEEARHLDEMRERLNELGEDVETRLAEFIAFEGQRFAILVAAFARDVALGA